MFLRWGDVSGQACHSIRVMWFFALSSIVRLGFRDSTGAHMATRLTLNFSTAGACLSQLWLLVSTTRVTMPSTSTQMRRQSSSLVTRLWCCPTQVNHPLTEIKHEQHRKQYHDSTCLASCIDGVAAACLCCCYGLYAAYAGALGVHWLCGFHQAGQKST